ncbi:MAG: rod shape-determining protein MreC [Raoultibacter sp.]
MALKFKDKSSAIGGPVLLIVLLVLSIAMVTLYAREGERGPLHSAQSAMSALSAPFGFVGSLAGSAGDSAGDALANTTASDGSLNGLKKQNEELRSMISQLEEYKQEAQRLQGLLGIKEANALDTISARVINRSSQSWNQVITIDKGENDGVQSGLPVVGSTGLIGQVIATTPFTADVRLLVDQQSGVAVLVQSNRAEGIVRGSFEGLLYLEDIASDAEVKQGDVVVTSGLGGGFSRGLIVGNVVKVEQKQGDASRKIIVAPNATTGSLEEVLVVTKVNSEGAAAEAPAPAAAAPNGAASDKNATTANGGDR